MMKKLGLLTALLICTALLSGPAFAVIYKYVDEKGQLVFVDDESKIPPQFRQATAPIKERTDDLTVEELEALRTRQEEERSEQALRQQAQREAAAKAQERDYQTPVMVRGNRVMVPVELAIGNRVVHLMLLLDTGASRTVFHRNALGDLTLPKGEEMQARIAGGQTLPTEKIKVHYLEVGPFREKNAEVMLIDSIHSGQPYDGMLGNDFLRKHPYEIDYRREIISWKKAG